MLTTLTLVLPHNNKVLKMQPLEFLRQEMTSELNRSEIKVITPPCLPIAGDQKKRPDQRRERDRYKLGSEIRDS